MTETLLIMLNEIPPLLRSDELLNDLYQAIDQVIRKLDTRTEVVFNEKFVDHAVGAGLLYLEVRLGIKTDLLKPLDQRRALIKARLKSKGKINLSKIDNICESWINGQVDSSISGSKIYVKFISVGGIPEGIEDLEATLLDIIPAHLKINLEYSFMTWDMLEAHNWTWDELESQNLTWDELEILVS